MVDDALLTRAQYASIAAFRLQLRRFLAFSEAAATKAGLAPQQHQALLAIAGHTGETPPSVGTIAAQLLIAPHTAAELVARMIDAGLVTKRRSTADRRRAELALTHKAEDVLRHLTEAHLRELRGLAEALARVAGSPE